MAAGSNLRRAELAIGRLVVETREGKELMDVKSLGPSCLATFESVEFLHSPVGTPKSNYFLVTSKRVLPKHNLLTIESSKKKKQKIFLKIFAEFLGTEDGRLLQRKPLSDFYLSLENDIFEMNGVTYVALTNKKGSSLLSRSLKVFNFSEGSESSVLWDELQCLDFGSERTQQEKNVAFPIRAYDLLQCDRFAGEDSQLRKRFLKEEDFQKGDKPLGQIIVNKDCQLAGFLYFHDKHPVPLLFGSKFTETGETITRSEIEKGGVYPLLESYLRVDEADTSEQLGETVYVNGKDQLQEENDEGPSPTENSCRSINSPKQMVEYIPPKNGETMQHGEIDTEMAVGASGGVYPLLEPDLLSKSQVHVGVSANGTEMPIGASGGAHPLLDPDLPSKSQVHVGVSAIDTEMPLGASGGAYPLLDPDLPSKSQVHVGVSVNDTEMPIRASGGAFPLLDPDLPSKSQVHVGVSANDTEMPVGASGGAFPLLDPDLPSKSQIHVGVSVNDSEMLVGASGGAYLLQDPDLPSKSLVGVGEIDKSSPHSTFNLAATNQQPVEKNVVEAEINITGAKNGSNSADLSDCDLQQPLVNGGSSNKELQEEKNLEQVTGCDVDGGRPSESLMFEAKVVKLPPKNGKDIPPSRVVPPDHDRVMSQPSSVTFDAVCEGASNIALQDRSTQKHSHLKKSYSCPSDLTEKDEYAQLKSTSSELLTRLLEEKRKFSPSDPLAKTILDCLELLEGLCRCLDKEYKYGACKCWKHIAEHFGYKEQEYQEFKCSRIHSPTEVMFEYLQTCSPDIAIEDIKGGLHSIGRQDVIGILVKYEKTYGTLNDETLVCSLFDSDPDIIGEMAFLLDMQKKGLKNWSHLAAKLDIPRNDFKSFETCNTENPTAGLFELLKIHFPRSTIKELIGHLEQMKRQDVIKAIKQSTKVTEGSLIKDLMADLDVMDNVCDLLNQKQRTNKVKGWKHLGTKYEMKKEILDDLSPIEEDLVCPTEALIANLGASMPWLTIADFILAIHKIDRKDALDVLEVYLPDGCFPYLLTSCDCERCLMSRQLVKAGETEDL